MTAWLGGKVRRGKHGRHGYGRRAVEPRVALSCDSSIANECVSRAGASGLTWRDEVNALDGVQMAIPLMRGVVA
jgi:hypothetical protein